MRASELLALLEGASGGRYTHTTLVNLVQKSFGISKAAVYADVEVSVSENALSRILHLVRWGTPFAYITGEETFYGRDFYVLPGVFIPRNETEILVEEACKGHFRSVLEFGCGSGAVLVSLLLDNDEATGVGVEVSYAARICTMANAVKHGVSDRLTLLEDLPSNGSFDLIVSNPPYVGVKELMHVDRSVLLFEPLQALFAVDPMDPYLRLMDYATDHLAADGRIVFELNPGVAQRLRVAANDQGFRLETVKDLQGNDRVAVLHR
ncbi:peptide chain release factor N(5)-glutamine methyltransferase [Coprothermobacteraceae bacterium]|nr:peptide chain release factor N(5)-glutamine methyltransferase [Coprothermobacteraceae bacterium]